MLSGEDIRVTDPTKTMPGAGRPADQQAPAADPLSAISRKSRLARFALVWEGLWPRLVLPAALAAVFAALAWLGLFESLPDVVRLALVGAFALAFLASLVNLARVRLPGRQAALDRLERDSGFSHKPLTALADRRAGGPGDPVAEALWQAHRRRVAASLTDVRVAAPSPRLDRLDPFVVRAAVVLLFAIGLVASRGDLAGPISAAVRLPTPPPPTLRIDAWVTPPGYTGRAPVYLTDAAVTADGNPAPRLAGADNPLEIPEGSVLTMRVAGIDAPVARFVREGEAPDASGEVIPPAEQAPAAAPQPAATAAQADDVVRPVSFDFTLGHSGTVTLGREGEDMRTFRFAVSLDLAPRITLVEEPAATQRGAFRLAYSVEDDYRVASARATFAQPKTALSTGIYTAGAEPRPLIGPPDMPLSLPRRGAKEPTAQTFKDLSAHPWAGAVVSMHLEAKDDAGKVGRSDPVDVVIPARPFRNPVARMLVEQRRILALDANAAPFVTDVLGTVLAGSERYIGDASIHLGLSVVHSRISHAATDDELRSALDFMWEMALAIDGGDASLAEQRLREARERLREALQNGASPEEIAKLTEELRQAMQEYMQALQEQMRNNPNLANELNQQQQQQQQNAQQVTPEDFQKMIDQIEEMSKLGDREAAEQLLSQLDQMLENLQMAQPQQGQQQQGQQGQQGPMNEMMNELADMIRRQQELMNETFNMSPDGRQQGPNGQMSEQEMQEAMRRLQEGQQQLQDRLQQLQKQMQEQGMDPGQQLGQAGESMGQAQESLGQGDSQQALGQQGQALDQLRQGAQQMAEQMGQEGEGQGRAGRRSYAEDPLGRPQRRDGPDFGDSVKVPGEIEVQRARRILEELRRRFSDPARPSIELDYLDRLLKPF